MNEKLAIPSKNSHWAYVQNVADSFFGIISLTACLFTALTILRNK